MIDIEALQKYSLFGGLLPDQVSVVRGLLGFESFEDGALLLTEGQANDRICFIVEGRVEVLKNGTSLNVLCEGETFGEMEMLDVMPAIATIRALGPVKVAILGNRALYRLSHENIRVFAIVVMNLARDLSRRLRRMDELAVKAGIAR
ncbi:MAG TPA: cyclic nucleotide-binding domain-containing protein [Rectinemataceae bacterium]|nr:cyclic nucleotide-binding domain-containing protein [Rectinemataceae bacterium]